jgi:hypothetical protein
VTYLIRPGLAVESATGSAQFSESLLNLMEIRRTKRISAIRGPNEA